MGDRRREGRISSDGGDQRVEEGNTCPHGEGGGRGQPEGKWAQGDQRSEGELRTADKYKAGAVGKVVFSERWSALGQFRPLLVPTPEHWAMSGGRGALASSGEGRTSTTHGSPHSTERPGLQRQWR